MVVLVLALTRLSGVGRIGGVGSGAMWGTLGVGLRSGRGDSGSGSSSSSSGCGSSGSSSCGNICSDSSKSTASSHNLHCRLAP
jgi:hypothetical protein